VGLDEDCRRQQLGEGWFSSLDEVPATAISMSIRQILKSRSIICAVPDERKAGAVQKVLEGAVSTDVPSSIMQTHDDCYIYLDKDSASLLSDSTG
jgi:glucosamine-6-phosphate deaminase